MKSRVITIVFVLAAVLLIQTGRLHGAPIFGETRSFPQPDGSVVELILNGDEFRMRAETPAGFTVVRDPQTDWICYAKLSADGTELVSTGVAYLGTNAPAMTPKAQVAGGIPTERHLDLAPANRLRQAQASRAALLGPLAEGTYSAKAAIAAPGAPVTANATTALPPRKSDLAKYSTTIRGLVLLIDFPDEPAPASPTYQDIVNSINQPNFHKADGRANSLRTFFQEISRGTFIVTNFVYGVYRATNTFAYYDNLGYTVGPQQLMGEALREMEAAGFDFSQLSVEGGEALDLCVMYTGSPKTWADGMWFHSGWWGSGPTYDGVRFRQYCTSTYSADPGTLIHEHGHLIADWPDMYSYLGANTGVWDVMGGGWTDLPNPYLLYQNGWLELTNICGSYGLRTMNSLNVSNALAYYDPAQPNEYYLIRPYTKSLMYCPDLPDEGLTLWRINLKGDNSQYPDKPLLCELVHANGVVANNSANVTFKAAGRNRYTDTTTPGSNWAFHDHQGQRSGLNLTGISAPGNTMNFRVSRPIYFYPVATQVSPLSVATRLQVTAVSDVSVSYAATGLPPGLYMAAATGLISGTPYSAGGYNVTVTATGSDGSQNTCEFAWLIGNTATTTAPAAWYAFNGNYLDSSAYGRTGTAVGTPVFADNTLQLNGTNTAVTIPRPLSGDFSIAFFMKTTVAGNSGGQWYNGSGLVDGEVGGATHDFGVSLTGDQVAFGVGSPSGDTTIQSLRKVTDGQWHHIAVTRSSSSGALKLYIDGTLDISGTGSTGTKTAPPGLRIGGIQTGGNYFNGALDEVRLYTTAISAAEIYRIGNSRIQLSPVSDQVTIVGSACHLPIQASNPTNLTFTATGLPTGLAIHPTTGVISGTTTTVGVYDVTVKAVPANGPEGTVQFGWGVCASTFTSGLVGSYPFAGNVKDVSGYNRNGTVVGAPTYPLVGIRFDGVADAVRIPRAISTDFTISFFVNAAAASDGGQWYNGAGLVDGEVNGAANDFGVSLTGSRIAFGVGSTSGDTTIQSTKTVTDRAWHHVAVTRTSASGAMAIYVDGRLDKSGTGPTGAKTSPPMLSLGALQTSINRLNGGLAEVKIYNRVLTAAEIFRNHQSIPADPGYGISQTQWAQSAATTLNWNTTPGEFYQVEWTADLGRAFAPLGVPVTAGAAYNATRNVAPTGTNGFYRVRKL